MKRRRWKMIALVAVVLYIALKMWCGAEEPAEVGSAELLPGYMWIEKLPSGEREHVHNLIVGEVRGERFGAIGFSSMYHYDFELVGWKIDGEHLELKLLQQDKTVRHHARVWRCEGEAPRPFQLCLELDKQRYYSRDDWKVRDVGDDAPDFVRKLAASFPGE